MTRPGCTPSSRRRIWFALVLATGAPTTWSGCTSEEVTAVHVSSVSVQPASVNALEGEAVPLSATVTDERGETLRAAVVSWTSDDPAVATVSDDGTVTARSPGTVAIRASVDGVSNFATVRVLAGPSIAVSHESVALFAGEGGAPPRREFVYITNGGAGSVEGLSIDVAYADNALDGWLDAALEGPAAPTRAVLTATTDGLSRGVYRATVSIAAEEVSHDPVRVPVTLTVTAFSVAETGGGTTVSESGSVDHLDVTLHAPPSSRVVLSVVSTDPGEAAVSPRTLTFLATDWQTPRRLTISGVDDHEVDGTQTSEIRVFVDAATSDNEFAGMPEHRTKVLTRDDEVAGTGIGISEPSGGTTVTEAPGTGQSQTFTVALLSPPSSNVVVAVASADPLDLLIDSAPTLVFNPDNWSAPQAVSVRAFDDILPDGDKTTEVLVRVVDALSAAAFRGLLETVPVRTLDNDQ